MYMHIYLQMCLHHPTLQVGDNFSKVIMLLVWPWDGNGERTFYMTSDILTFQRRMDVLCDELSDGFPVEITFQKPEVFVSVQLKSF